MTPDNLRLLTNLVRARSGIVLGPDKLYLMRNRLDPLLRRERLADLDALADRLGRAPAGDLVRRTVEAVTVNETYFFRDPATFAHLTQEALPGLHRARLPGDRLRLWSAATSTGQEAWSMALAVGETWPPWPPEAVEVLGTDLAAAPLERAQAGLYSQFEVDRGLSPERLRAGFGAAPGGWRVLPRLRALVQFRPWNLLDDPAPLGRFDVVFCRHVLLYFDPDTRRAVLDGIAAQLAPDGFLYVGGTETLMGVSDRFVPVPRQRGAYVLAAG